MTTVHSGKIGMIERSKVDIIISEMALLLGFYLRHYYFGKGGKCQRRGKFGVVGSKSKRKEKAEAVFARRLLEE